MAQARPRIATFGAGFLGTVAIFCGFAVVAWLLFRFTAPTVTFEDKRRENREAKLAAIRQDAEDKLHSLKWVDKGKGVVQIPIESAMELVVNEYQARPVHPSQVKVDDPYPYGLQTPAAAAAAASPAANQPDVRTMPAGSPAAAPSATPVLHIPAVLPAPTAVPLAAPASSPEVKP